MTRRILILGLVLSALVAFSGCSIVKKEYYQALVDQDAGTSSSADAGTDAH